MEDVKITIKFPPAEQCLQMIKAACKQANMSSSDAFVMEAWVSQLMQKAGLISEDGTVKVEAPPEPEGDPLEGDVLN